MDGLRNRGAPTSEESHRQLGHIARGGAVNLLGALVSAASGFLLVIIVTNEFDEDTAGRLFAVVSAFLIGVAISSLGSDTGLARFLLPQEGAGSRRALRDTIRHAFGPVAITSLALSISVFVGADTLAEWLGMSGTGGAAMVRVFAVALPFAVLAEFWLGCTRAFDRMRPTVAIDSISRSVLQVGGVLVAAWFGATQTGLSVAWAAPYVIAGILATAVATRLVARRTSRPVPDAAGERNVTRAEFWRYTTPRAVARVSQIGLQRIDIVLIAAILGPGEAAVYTAATRFVVLGQFATLAIQRVLQPRLSDLIAREQTATIRDVFKVSTAWSMALSWPLYLVVAAAAPLYLRLFGSGYEIDAAPVVVTMAVGMMLVIGAGPLDTLLLMGGRSTTSLLITVTALAIDVGLVFALLPGLGIAGAAIAWATALVVRNLLTFSQVYRSSGVTPFSRGALTVAAASFVCFAMPILALSLVGRLTFATLGLAVVIGAAMYYAVLWTAREALALSALRALFQGRGGNPGE